MIVNIDKHSVNRRLQKIFHLATLIYHPSYSGTSCVFIFISVDIMIFYDIGIIAKS